jgi:hypothetical protein
MPVMPDSSFLRRDFCDIFGNDINGAVRVLGGLDERKPTKQWYCPNHSVGKYRMVCEHGHVGPTMKLCVRHYNEFGTGEVRFCPRCNIPPNDHKCTVKAERVS